MKKRNLLVITSVLMVLVLTFGTVGVSAQVYQTDEESYLIGESSRYVHEHKNFDLLTNYKITEEGENQDSALFAKKVNVSVSAINVSEGTEVLIEDIYAVYTVDGVVQDTDIKCYHDGEVRGLNITGIPLYANTRLKCYEISECHLYGNEIRMYYELLVRNAGEKEFHKVSCIDGLIVPTIEE